jgi:fumarate reductase subunit C
MRRRTYFAFILRELSSLFVVWFVVFTLVQIRALSQGAEGYQQFLNFARNPAVVAVNLIALFFVVFHAITWFNLAPKAMVVHLRGKRLPSAYIAAPNYIAWIAVSALVAWIILRQRS